MSNMKKNRRVLFGIKLHGMLSKSRGLAKSFPNYAVYKSLKWTNGQEC